MDSLIIFLLVFIETSVYVDFPYNVVSISFVAFLTSKYELMALPYAVVIGFLVGLSGHNIQRPIIFFIFFVIIMNEVFKYFLFEKINLIFISLIEISLYLSYIYFFEFSTIYLNNIIKLIIFVLSMNYILYRSERQHQWKEKI